MGLIQVQDLHANTFEFHFLLHTLPAPRILVVLCLDTAHVALSATVKHSSGDGLRGRTMSDYIVQSESVLGPELWIICHRLKL
jgi:hypothetical protein